MEVIAVNPDRLKSDFEELSQIGLNDNGGIDRPTFSEAHLQARFWFRQKVREAGLNLHVDEAGNHSALLKSGPEGAQTLILGSHLDSVPNGGKYDGALGVLAALESLRVVRESNLKLPVNLEAIDFTDEEGTLVGLLGSAALAGCLDREAIEKPRGGRENFLLGLNRAGLNEADLMKASRDPRSLAGYLELHIEQGPNLSKSGINIGIVTGIVGICSYKITFLGQSDHAGTTPMKDRLDAFQGAAAFALAMKELITQDFPGCVANIGWIRSYPGAFNIVPGCVEFGFELRSADERIFLELEARLIELAGEVAAHQGLGLETELLGRHRPAPMSSFARKSIEKACSLLGLSSIPIASGAGHDAQMPARICPAGMIFIPSQGGSHSPREHADWQDFLKGANVLLNSALLMASSQIS